MKVESFRGEYGFLSNFSESRIVFEGVEYPTVEHAYQAAKTDVASEKQVVAAAASPSKAKQLGKRVTIRKDWNSVRLNIMGQLLRLKFADPKLAKRLLDTGDMMLVEGNNWNDVFWGVCRGRGFNHLGRILMEIRDELRRVHERVGVASGG